VAFVHSCTAMPWLSLNDTGVRSGLRAAPATTAASAEVPASSVVAASPTADTATRTRLRMEVRMCMVWSTPWDLFGLRFRHSRGGRSHQEAHGFASNGRNTQTASQGEDPGLVGRDIRPVSHRFRDFRTGRRARVVAPAALLRSPSTGPVRDVSGPWSGLF